MTILDHIEEVKKFTMSDEHIEHLRTQMAEADKRFVKEVQERAISKKWLDRVYSDIPDYK